jgi:hypothetical protein
MAGPAPIVASPTTREDPMIRRLLLCLLVPGAVAATGCQHAPHDIAPAPRLGAKVGREELLATGRPLLLDALRAVRPSYFLSRGPTTLTGEGMVPMVIVIQGMVVPDLEPLRTTPVGDVVEVRRLSASETYFRFNRSVSVGAIEVTLRTP